MERRGLSVLVTGGTGFASSRTGVLIYQDRDDESRLAWFDRTGREVGSLGPPGNYRSFSLAPDGRRVFAGSSGGNR